jgi:hypothetical protein
MSEDLRAQLLKIFPPSPIPALLRNYSLLDLIDWYESNLCGVDLLDPRNHMVAFDLSRLAYLIKLNNSDGTKLAKPLQAMKDIKSGIRSQSDFSGPLLERSERLSWLELTIKEPCRIRKNDSLVIPADDVYIREFAKSGYRFKVLYCKRMSDTLLVPVTSFREKHEPKGEILWSK